MHPLLCKLLCAVHGPHPEEARTIRAELDRGGTAALEARGLRCWALGNGYLVVET